MSQVSPTGQSDVVYTDGEVLVDSKGEAAEAILIRGGRVAAVGSNAEVLSAAGTGVERQSLDGATVIPGLIDTHPHLMHFAAMRAPLVDITEARNHSDIIAAIRAKAAEVPAGEWILTTPVGEYHYFHRRSWHDLAEGALPDRYVLDRAAPDHPVLIQAVAPVLPNVVAMNSAALAKVGITASTPDRVNNVWIEKDSAGSPTGILRGSVTSYYNQDPFFNSLREQMPELIQRDLVVDALLKGVQGYNAMGITTVYEGHAIEIPQIELYRALSAQGLLNLRVQAAPELQGTALPGDRPKSVEEARALLETALAMRTRDDDWMRVDGVTACTYGTCYSGNVLSHDGYLDPYGNVTHGHRAISEENMRLAFDFCAEHGLRLNVVSITPDEHDEAIALAEETIRKYGLDRFDGIIQHAEMTRPGQSKRLAELGFDLTVSSSFTFGKGDMIAERFGPEALTLLNTFRTHLDAGLSAAAGMDWGPTNPFEQMQIAVTHQMFPSGRTNAGPAQAISRAEAFAMWTANGAKLLGWEGIGTLSPGNHADLAIVDRNPITCEIDALPTTRVLRTHVGGRLVHDNGVLPAKA
ncbi:amidohydrolase family protein [Nocardia sp. R6R-6]|uniref:amidohydrolase family protein n=1 Tax=Nocardia sp. R6R-6 TaxID=3459303 RepID=UPI00403DB04E